MILIPTLLAPALISLVRTRIILIAHLATSDFISFCCFGYMHYQGFFADNDSEENKLLLVSAKAFIDETAAKPVRHKFLEM